MGFSFKLRIRKKDLKLASSRVHRDPVLDKDHRGKAHALSLHYRRTWKRYGVTPVYKSTFWGRLSKMSTTYYKQVRLGTTYRKLSDGGKALTDGHETVHVKQWRHYGRSTFRTRYLFWTRWRWAVEVQAYAESVRVLVALGARDEEIREYITSRPTVLWEKYVGMKLIRKRDLWSNTILVLQQAYDDARKGRPA